MKFTIEGELPSLNEFIDALKVTKYVGNRMKQETQAFIGWQIKQGPVIWIRNPVKIKFTWYSKNERKDLDNVCFAKKFILDTLVSMCILRNDTRRWVKGFEDTFEVDKLRPRVEVEIEELLKEGTKCKTNLVI
jgi:Holliday junction resolvase RusA-like endonuclease